VTARSSSRRWLHIFIGVALSALFLWIAVRGIAWSELSRSLADADYRWIPAMAVVGVYALLARTQRWRLLLDQATGTELPMSPVFSANAIGFMANMLLPLRAGEIARPVLLSRRMRIPLAVVLATVVLERILDLATLVVFAMWVVSTSTVPTEVRAGAWMAGIAFTVMVITLTALHFQRARLLPIVDKIWRVLPPRLEQAILQTEHRFLDALATIGDAGMFLRALAWSFWIWIVIAVGFALGFYVVGIDVPFLGGGISVATVVALAVAAPAAPGFVGAFQFACKIALQEMRGVDGALTLGYSLITHATQFSTQVVVGLVYLLREGLSLGEIGRMEAERTEQG
jgi:uncharacterized protein (TIRG00374 family)